MQLKIFLIAALAVIALGWNFNNPYLQEKGLTYHQQQVQYFDQVLDHFTYLPAQFWKQRYFVNS